MFHGQVLLYLTEAISSAHSFELHAEMRYAEVIKGGQSIHI